MAPVTERMNLILNTNLQTDLSIIMQDHQKNQLTTPWKCYVKKLDFKFMNELTYNIVELEPYSEV